MNKLYIYTLYIFLFIYFDNFNYVSAAKNLLITDE